MEIMLCGAQDLALEIAPKFKKIVNAMGFKPRFYPDLMGAEDPYKTPEQLSRDSVKLAQLIVFVMIERSGKITWDIEYRTAISLGKPFLILIGKDLHNTYYDIEKQAYLSVGKKHKHYNAIQILNMLQAQKRRAISYKNLSDFSSKLREFIVHEIEKGMQALETEYKKEGLLEVVRHRDYKIIDDEDIKELDVETISSILFDVFQNKETRKRVLYFFTRRKVLSDEQIIDLIEDSEQGISRYTIELLPDLIGTDNKKHVILDRLIQIAEDSGDTGIIRRSITAICQLDPTYGLKLLISLFPANDIGIPKRIMKWYLEHESEWKAFLKDKDFKNDLGELINLCSHFSNESESLKSLVDKLKKSVSSSRKSK